MKLTRYKGNPILKPSRNKWESKAVFNPGVVLDNKIKMLYRAIGEYKNGISRLGYAESTDGFNFNRLKKPVLRLEEDYEKYGMEDPRITKFGDKFYITYVVLRNPALSPNPLPQTALAVTEDFRKFKRLGKITSPGADDKDVLLFPERFRNEYAFIHRPNKWVGYRYETQFPSIWISHSSKFVKLWHPHLLMKPKFSWESMKIGGGCPPIKTERGWLVIYHGIDDDFTYRVGAVLLDLKNPRRVLARLKEPILEPKKAYEREDGVKKIVFPTGAVVEDSKLLVYYGASDRYIAVAYCNLEELLNSFEEQITL